jgi:hypothetical protein
MYHYHLREQPLPRHHSTFQPQASAVLLRHYQLLIDLYHQVPKQFLSTSSSKPPSPSMGDIKGHPMITASLTSNMSLQRCLNFNYYPFNSRILIDPPNIWTSIPQPQHGSSRGGAPHLHHQPSLPSDATRQTLIAQSTATTKSFLSQDTTTTSRTTETNLLNSPELYCHPYIRWNKPSQPQALTHCKPTHIHC